LCCRPWTGRCAPPRWRMPGIPWSGQELEAGIVILHLGHVDMPSPTPLFRQLHAKGEQGRGDLESAVTEQLALRAVSQRRHLDAALFGLERLEREAERRGLWLAVENPGQLHEIPDRAEMAFILQEFKGARIGYWHDVGHAAVQANLGLAGGNALLKDFGDRLLGLDIHDAQGLEDHLAPGQGAIDFLALKGVAPTAVRVVEVAGEVQRDDLRRGIATLRALWEA